MKKTLLTTLAFSTSLFCFTQSFSLVKPDPSEATINSNSITDLIIDDTKIVCYTRGDSALAIYDGTNWTYKGYQSLGFSGNYTVSADLDMAPNGDYWLACASGLDVVSGNTVSNMTATNSELKNDYFMDLSMDNNGLTFIAYSNGFGISMFENGTWTHRSGFSGNLEPFNLISAAYFMEVNKQTNDTWIISSDNFFKLNNGNLTTYTSTSTDIPYNSASNVTGMTVTADGNVWFSLKSNSNDPAEGGLLSFDGTDWTHYNTDNSGIHSNNITALASYENQIIFNNYSIDGISVYDGTDWNIYDGTEGTNYPTGAQYHVHEMKAIDNIIYMGTNSGLYIMELPETVGLKENNASNISVYPNPTANSITVDSDLSNLFIRILNSAGVLVHSEHLMNKQVDISSLSKGVYFVSIETNGETISTQKVIKE
ncbi:MAG TPA: T9SS type A sorting domain-containing protein [Brumimicrobium sp.]|nr:T9SS type A sorting domain-containing protein [Brumimicrobium sp.]